MTKLDLGLPLLVALFAAGVCACAASDPEPSDPSGSAPSANGVGSAASTDGALDPGSTQFEGQDEPELACDQTAADQLTQFQQFSVDLQTLYCQRQYECCSADERLPPAFGEDTLEFCLATAGNLNADPFVGEENIACGRVHFRADLAATCLDEIRNASCDDVKQLPDCVVDQTVANETHLLLEPASPAGSVCNYGSETCVGGYCDTGGMIGGYGQCVPYKVQGDACVEDYECQGGSCGDEGCSTRSGIGEITFCWRF